MKTFAPGLSDSIASVIEDPQPCPHCDSSSHIAGGLCVGCLLEAGLDPGEEGEAESLNGILAEVNLPDQNWRLGNYEILEEIGRGGMGVIYRARQRHSRRIVAVKRVLSYHSDSRETLARFQREAVAAASLDHPNILPIYEVSQGEDGLPFFSMKFASGGTLQQVAPALRSEPRQCVALVAKIARAVQYAHSRGILHRDLKPGNILLDARGEPLVSDFGLAKWLDTTSDLTRTLTIFGTPGYIAPEQASSAAAELKPTADVYSLGAILFDLLAGRPPFLGAHALSVIRQAAELPAPKLRTLTKLADRDLETICSRCLERDPKLRYASAHDLAEDLERWLQGRPIIARPVSPAVRMWRWSRRNQRLAATIGACLVLAAIAVTWLLQSRQLSARVREEQSRMHSVAILPFLDLDNPSDHTEVVQTITPALREAMQELGPTLVVSFPASGRVLSSAATMDDLQEAAKVCHTRTVLSGTFRKIDGRTQVSVRLQDAANGQLLINRTTLEHNSKNDIVVFSRSLARELYSALNSRDLSTVAVLKRDPALNNPTARDLLLAGRELETHRTTIDLDHAIECFQNAFRSEPSSALARAHFVMAVISRLHQGPWSQDLLVKAQHEASEAIRLNSAMPEAHRAMASVYLQKNELSKATEEVLRAIELGGAEERPALFMGMLARRLGEPGIALSWYEVAKRWQNRPANNEFIIGDCLVDLQQDDRAESIYKRVSELHPELPEGWMGLCRLRMLHQDFQAARQLYSENRDRYKDFAFTDQMGAQVEFFSRNYPEAKTLYESLVKRDPEGGGDFYGSVTFQSALGCLLLLHGNADAGRVLLNSCLDRETKALEQAPHHAGILYRLAAIEASLQKAHSSLAYLEAAAKDGWIDSRSLALDPRFDSIRTEERYQRVFEKMVTRVTSSRRNQSSDIDSTQ
jgi:serine/threonine protein kinase/tetratricopeptide (TPR) repeat protein